MRFAALAFALIAASSDAVGQLRFDIAPTTQSGLPGSQLTFQGAIENTGGSDIFLNGATYEFDGLVSNLDFASFWSNAPSVLSPGQRWSGDLFTLALGGESPGLYRGSVSLLGGVAPASSDVVGSAGFTAEALRDPFRRQTLVGTVRDFSPGPLNPVTGSNPDFESCISGVAQGLVETRLTGPAPTLRNPSSPGGCINSADSFAAWWSNSGPRMQYSLELVETAPGSGVYGFTSNTFFPIDGELLGNFGSTGRNFHFTYHIQAQFAYRPGTGQTFAFSGDDDVWVYFNNILGIDLGGVHPSASSSVNLDDLFGSSLAEGMYSFDLFFAERHTGGSNLSMQTSLELVPITTTPEPGTFVLLAFGLGVLVSCQRGKAMRRRIPPLDEKAPME